MRQELINLLKSKYSENFSSKHESKPYYEILFSNIDEASLVMKELQIFADAELVKGLSFFIFKNDTIIFKLVFFAEIQHSDLI